MHPKVEKVLDKTEKRAKNAEQNIDSVDGRGFIEAIEDKKLDGLYPIIGEVKPTSPTTDGVVDRDPIAVANEIVSSGAVALSVLTEPTFFGGSIDNLKRIRSSVDVPILRKDFIVNEKQLYEVESDSILLIAAFIEDLEKMVDKAFSIGFEPLVEVHTEEELETALETKARLVGVNNRNLKKLDVDLTVSENLIPKIPNNKTAIAESGISSIKDAKKMFDAGADALLVGTSIMQDPKRKTRELVNLE